MPKLLNLDRISANYPGDIGIRSDPAVVWFEDFNSPDIATITGRYDSFNGQDRMYSVADSPLDGGRSLEFEAGEGVNAVDLYKKIENQDEIYIRWYVKYLNGPYSHTGMWFGGYNPPLNWPYPRAGQVPTCDSHASFAVEHNDGTLETYNYWCNQRGQWGNQLVEKTSFTLDEEEWVCLETHVKMNEDLNSDQGAVLEIWKNDELVQRLDDATVGYWVGDSFCTSDSDKPVCVDNRPAELTESPDLQFRNTTDLGINHIWPQNYNTDSVKSSILFDQIVVATKRIGCAKLNDVIVEDVPFAANYPNDIGIENDPAMVFFMDFEEDTIEEATSGFEWVSKPENLALVSGEIGNALETEAGAGDTVELFKLLPEDTDTIFVRYLSKYNYGVPAAMQGVGIMGRTDTLSEATKNDCSVLVKDLNPNISAHRIGVGDDMQYINYRCGAPYENTPAGPPPGAPDAIARDSIRQEKYQWHCHEIGIDRKMMSTWVNDQLIYRQVKGCNSNTPNCEVANYGMDIGKILVQNFIPDDVTQRSKFYIDQLAVAKKRIGCPSPWEPSWLADLLTPP